MDQAYRERFLRSIGIFTEEQLLKLKSTRVAVAGLGLGGSVFLNLVRLGIEQFHIADPDSFERTNINRQRLAKETTIGLRKDECTLAEAKAINPHVKVILFKDGVKANNLSDFLWNIDWVVDVVDIFAMNDKLALNMEARKQGLPVASCATVGFSGSVVIFNNKTPSFAELTGISSDNSNEENISRFARFICPEIPEYMQEQLTKAMNKSGYVPFVPCGGEIAAAITAAEITKHIVGLGRKIVAPQGIFVDAAEVRTEIYKADYRARELTFNHIEKKRAA